MTRRKSPEGKVLGGCSEKRRGERLARTRVYRTLDLRLNLAGHTDPLPRPAVDVAADVAADVEPGNPHAQPFCNPLRENKKYTPVAEFVTMVDEGN